MNKVKITNWTDIFYITTILYSIFLCFGFFYEFEASVNFFGKEYETTLNFFTWVQVTNPDLEKWKLYLLLICLIILSIIIDKLIIQPLLYKTTKEYKVIKMETNKKFMELKNEKK